MKFIYIIIDENDQPIIAVETEKEAKEICKMTFFKYHPIILSKYKVDSIKLSKN